MSARLKIEPWAAVLILSGAVAAAGTVGEFHRVAAATAEKVAEQESRVAALESRVEADSSADAESVAAGRLAGELRCERLASAEAVDHYLANLGPEWRVTRRIGAAGSAHPPGEEAELMLIPSGLGHWKDVLRALDAADVSGLGIFEFEAATTQSGGSRVFEDIRIGLDVRTTAIKVPVFGGDYRLPANFVGEQTQSRTDRPVISHVTQHSSKIQ